MVTNDNSAINYLTHLTIQKGANQNHPVLEEAHHCPTVIHAAMLNMGGAAFCFLVNSHDPTPTVCYSNPCGVGIAPLTVSNDL